MAVEMMQKVRAMVAMAWVSVLRRIAERKTASSTSAIRTFTEYPPSEQSGQFERVHLAVQNFIQVILIVTVYLYLGT